MLRPTLCSALAVVLLAGASFAQDSDFGVTVPMTLSAGAMRTGRLQEDDPSRSLYSEGFRIMLYPTFKLGKHWFGYAAVQLRENPYFYYDAYYPGHAFDTDAIQAYIGYSTRLENTSIVIKAGQLTTAFGSFPLRYDDTENPLLDQPLSYITQLPIRGDQLICNVADLRKNSYGWVAGSCGGNGGWAGGLTPVTLYGLPGAQIEASRGHFDGRLQFTGRSPAVSDEWTTRLSYFQWAAGGGYTITQGVRIGMSAFRGPYLDRVVSSYLPAGTSIRDFPATGVGIDGQFVRGHWNINGEWQRFQFDLPNFTVSPTTTAGYGEVKRILTPRFYAAVRAGYLKNGSVTDASGVSLPLASIAPTLTDVEFGGGIWLRRNLLLKGSYGWLHMPGSDDGEYNVLGLQLVATIHKLNWAWR